MVRKIILIQRLNKIFFLAPLANILVLLLVLFFLQKTSHNILNNCTCTVNASWFKNVYTRNKTEILRESCFAVYRNTLMTDFAAFQMLWNKIGPLVSRDFQSHLTVLMHMEEFIRQMCFHLTLLAHSALLALAVFALVKNHFKRT